MAKVKRPYKNRNSTRNRRQTKKRFLIVCEGTETEPNYFEALGRQIKQKVNIIPKREGKVTLSLVKEAKRLKDEDGGYEEDSDDEVWCVFDRDLKKENKNQQNFDAAIRLAYNNNINLAISNDAFELWFLLHYSYYQSETHRSDFEDKLKQIMGEKYKKNDPELYYKFKDLTLDAIKYAKKLWNSHDQNIAPNLNEIDKLIAKHNINPSTTVHKLVEKLTENKKSKKISS